MRYEKSESSRTGEMLPSHRKDGEDEWLPRWSTVATGPSVGPVSFVWLRGCTIVVFAASKHGTEPRMPNADAGVQGVVQVG